MIGGGAGSTSVIWPFAVTTVGKNGDAACRPKEPSSTWPSNAKMPSAGSLLRSPRMTVVTSPFAVGPTPVSRTRAPIGTPWPFSTVPRTVPGVR